MVYAALRLRADDFLCPSRAGRVFVNVVGVLPDDGLHAPTIHRFERQRVSQVAAVLRPSLSSLSAKQRDFFQRNFVKQPIPPMPGSRTATVPSSS